MILIETSSAVVNLCISLCILVVFGHLVIGEQSRIRKYLLYIFAKYIEVPLLRTCYFLFRGKWKPIGDIKLVRIIGKYILARPFGYLGDSARPVPYNELMDFIDQIDGPIAVGPCRCRMGHRGCDHPMETDIVFRTGFNAWTRAFPKEYRQIEKEEAKAIVTRCHDLGMFHMVFIHCPVNLYNEYVVCNCCTCGCVPYIINHELGQLNYPLIDGYYLAVTDREKCAGQGKCVEVCPFEARILKNGRGITGANCFGCGLCSYICPENAITMKKLRDPVLLRHEAGNPPSDYRPGLYKQHPPIVEKAPETEDE